MNYNSQHIPTILKSVKTINHHANEFLGDDPGIGYDDFINYYKDYKSMMKELSFIDDETKKLVRNLPDLENNKIGKLLALIFYSVFIIIIWPYFFITIPFGLVSYLLFWFL